MEFALTQDASVVDQDVNSAELSESGMDKASNCFGIGYVVVTRNCLAAFAGDFRDNRVGRFRGRAVARLSATNVINYDSCAASREDVGVSSP